MFVNFGCLAIGRVLMGDGPNSEWYTNLNKAPWTPRGWVFGVAWSTIMICFSIYLAQLFKWKTTTFTIVFYIIQVFLNVSWNWFFFNRHRSLAGLAVICLLTLVIFYYFFKYKSKPLIRYRFLLLPYLIWLCIATSLNAYVVMFN